MNTLSPYDTHQGEAFLAVPAALRELVWTHGASSDKTYVVGKGGEHLVYASTFVSGAVIKLSCFALRHYNPPGTTYHQRKDAVSTEILTRQRRYERLEEYFTAQTVWQEFNPHVVYLDQAAYQYIFATEGEPDDSIFHTFLAYQERVPALEVPGKILSLSAPPPEKNATISSAQYAWLNRRWTSQEACQPMTVHDMAWFSLLHGNFEIDRLADELQGNPRSVRALREFVQNCYDFSDQTGETLDMGNVYNVVLTPTSRLILVDALVPVADTYAQRLPQLLAKLHTNPNTTVSRTDAATLINGLQYVRFVNFLAALAGSPTRIIPHAQQLTVQSWTAALQAIHTYFPP